MSDITAFDTELRWQKSVAREAELKNHRYPWNISHLSYNRAENEDFTHPSLPPSSSKKFSASALQKPPQCLLSPKPCAEFPQESRLKPFQPSPRRLSLALDSFLKGVGDIEKELKHMKKLTKASGSPLHQNSALATL